MTVEKNDVYKAMWWLENQRVFFFGAFLLGTALILALKSAKVNGALVSLVAVSVMLAYAATGVRNKIKIRLDVLGDNLYYLGFLYTLVSLSYSLYALGKGSANINDLLENFGLAITTTLSGLALRVFFNQPKADIVEYENTVRLSLTEATANFVAEASKIGTDVSTLRAVLNQVVQETQETQKKSNQTLSRAVDDQIGLLDLTSKRNQENIDALLQKLEAVQNSFAENFDVNTKAMKKVMTSSMNQIEKGAENFTASFVNISSSIEELAFSIGTITGNLKGWDEPIEKMLSNDEKLKEKLAKSSENLSRAQESFNLAIVQIPISLRGATNNLEKALQSFTEKAVQSEIQLNESWSKINGMSDKAALEIKKFIDELEIRKFDSARLNDTKKVELRNE